MIEAVWLTFAFTLGMLVRSIGLPPLVGYLAAGFALSAAGKFVDLPLENGKILQHIAHLGVLLLLFTVGLKLKLKSLLRPEVIGGGILHFVITTAIFTPALLILADLDWRTSILLGIALSFSSTVLAAKVLEAKRELRAFHGRVAIGILIVQDLIALLVMSIAGGTSPSLWALLVFLMPLLRPALYRLLDSSGHEELMLLFGLLLALAAGGYGFESVGLSSELGALLFGALLANHPRAKELSDSLWGIKEIFLVGFFLQIGIGGLPDGQALVMALAFALVLPLKGILFFFLLLFFRLRSRSAFLSSLSLTNYSEFGLIVASVVLPEWMVPLALTVAISFVLSAPLNRVAHPLYEALASRLAPFERNLHHPDEQPISLLDTRILIMGMGRTGSAAYDYLKESEPKLMGLDSDPAKIQTHIDNDRKVFFADAEDPVFWERLQMPEVDAVILAMNDIEAKVIAARKLRQCGFQGLIVAHTMFPDEAEAIRRAGADHAYLTFSEAGVGLAERVRTQMSGRASQRSRSTS
jgi:predicted Kef-type K+ transport protein